jgi:hypothetical protein
MVGICEEPQGGSWLMALVVVVCRGQILPAEAKVLAVFEDWNGDGAGNGEARICGSTVYAWVMRGRTLCYMI